MTTQVDEQEEEVREAPEPATRAAATPSTETPQAISLVEWVRRNSRKFGHPLTYGFAHLKEAKGELSGLESDLLKEFEEFRNRSVPRQK